jgi:HD-GYP domain-containing protein (c-di-GMP phosphodiesterase class II)
MPDLLEKSQGWRERLWPRRIPLLYLILSMLLALSVIPLMIYGSRVSSRNREALQNNEKFLQLTVTQSMAQEIILYLDNVDAQIDSIARLLDTTGAIADVASPKYAQTLDRAIESFVGGGENVRFVTIVNADMLGRQGGVPEIGFDEFIRKRVGEAFQTSQLNNRYHSSAFLVRHADLTEPMIVVARPLAQGNDFRGMIAAVVSLEFLRQRLQQSSQGGLIVYVVDGSGRLAIHPSEREYTIGQDMSQVEIVRGFLNRSVPSSMTTTFMLEVNGKQTLMLGTQVAVRKLNWVVVAQKPVSEAYITATELERNAFVLGLIVVFISVVVAYFSARTLTAPIEVLAQTTRAIAKGDFSRRVHVPSRTEIGELAETFNLMTDDLERYVQQLKDAATENHELFLGSIRTLSAAIDEKDPYTRGHSGRVSKYATTLAEHMSLPEDEVYRIRISGLLHDVGKIGIEDRILKKPGALTPEEFEVMKTHTTKGAHIIRPVARLADMLPGIELHHESLDGRGYPHGLKGDAIPLMARIISVADTLDAMTTNRPYQAAMELEVALEKIQALKVKKFDPRVVDALVASVEAGNLKLAPTLIEV